jgi:hypothetical protein
VSVTRRTLLVSLGLTLPVAAAEAATRHKKPVAAKHPATHASHAGTHTTRTVRNRHRAPAPLPPAQS